MLDTQEICAKFGTLREYEKFHNEWARACYRLNPTEKNKERMQYSEKVLSVLGVQNE
jgi:hypothetical protein